MPHVGEVLGQDGQNVGDPRFTRLLETIVADGLPRYAELTMRGRVFSVTTALAGITLAAANISPLVAATGLPIVGVFNPPGSGVIVIPLFTVYGPQATGAAAVNEGIPVWNVAAPDVISTQAGTIPLSHKTLTAVGSKVIGLVNQALTGNVRTWVPLRPFGADAVRVTAPTASINVNALSSESTDGLTVVPPGCAMGLAVLAAGTTITVAGAMVWAEYPIV